LSNRNNPRPLKLKKLPKGKFNWKITFNVMDTSKFGMYSRYYNDDYSVPDTLIDYINNKLSGKFFLHAINRSQYDIKRNKKRKKSIKKRARYDYVLLESYNDVLLLKLIFDQYIRQIYTVVTNEA
jgi:hypothetical protein